MESIESIDKEVAPAEEKQDLQGLDALQEAMQSMIAGMTELVAKIGELRESERTEEHSEDPAEKPEEKKEGE